MGLNENTIEPSQTVPLGQWNTIYLVYAVASGGTGVARLYINGNQMSAGLNMQNVPNNSPFSNSDIIKIGGVFTGNLRRMQIYSPATFGTSQGTGKSSSEY